MSHGRVFIMDVKISVQVQWTMRNRSRPPRSRCMLEGYDKVNYYSRFPSRSYRIKYLEAVKTFKGMRYGPYCAISGTEPSSVTVYKPA